MRMMLKNRAHARLLMTIPGISFYSALLIKAEIWDVSRFPDSGHLVSYACLAPSIRESGGKAMYEPITKQGSSYFRWILVQAAWTNIRSYPDGSIARFYRRMRERKGGKKAITTAAAKPLRAILDPEEEKAIRFIIRLRLIDHDLCIAFGNMLRQVNCGMARAQKSARMRESPGWVSCVFTFLKGGDR